MRPHTSVQVSPLRGVGPRHALAAAALATLLLAACGGDQVSHFRVPKEAAAPGAPSGGAPAGMPGMAGDVPPPPAPAAGAALTWTLPKGWTETRQGGMRFATLKAPVAGKLDGSVIVLPGPAGGELANVNRWRGQIALGPIDESELVKARKPLQTKAGTLSVYDFTSEGQQKSRVIAGLIEVAGSTWFIKLTGDATAVAAARADFMSLLGSLRTDG